MSGIELAPDAMLDVTIRLGRTHILAAEPTRLQVLIETRPSVRTRHATAPVDIRLVVDASGSMSQKARHDAPSKLEVVKLAILKLLAQLNDRDSVLLSVFSTDGRMIVPKTHMTSEALGRIQNAVQGLHPELDTNISAGLELAMAPSIAPGTLPRVILFTDGMSSYPETDHPRLVDQADLARSRDIPLSIYGTGSGYNWSLLQQVAIRAGGGSFCKHVMDVETLEGHMLAELAFLRGTAIERFEIEGRVPRGVTIVCAKTMMPQIRELVPISKCGFQDRTGGLDLHRGAQYLVELEVAQPTPGELTVLFLTFRGRNRTTLQTFEHSIELPVTFVHDATQESPVDEQVRNVLLMLAAAKKAEEGAYEDASRLYRRAGDNVTATAMDELHTDTMRPGSDQVDLGRTATSMAWGSVTETYTIDPNKGRGGRH